MIGDRCCCVIRMCLCARPGVSGFVQTQNICWFADESRDPLTFDPTFNRAITKQRNRDLKYNASAPSSPRSSQKTMGPPTTALRGPVPLLKISEDYKKKKGISHDRMELNETNKYCPQKNPNNRK